MKGKRFASWFLLACMAAFIVFTIFFYDASIVNIIISAVTIASLVLSVTDVVFSMLDIKKKEREELFSLHELSDMLENYYSREIERKYAEEASKIIESLENALDEKQLLCLESIMEAQETDDEERTEQKIEEIETRTIDREKKQYLVVWGVVGIGVLAFIMILAGHIEIEAAVVNLLTEIAFLFVILNILIKDYYKEKSLKEISLARDEVKEDIVGILRR